MDHLKCFYPFFKIFTSSNIQKMDYNVPYLALDLLTLLIEKGRLLGRAVPTDEIERHVERTMGAMYPDREFDCRAVSRAVLELLETDNQGMLYHFQYPDPVRKNQVDHYIHLVEYDMKERAYRITDEGLDFMISIKELPEESKVSVSLILFKKQIESGSFRNALETIRELNLEVQRKKRKKEDLLERLLYGSPDVIEDFEKYTHEVLSQLKQEHELFTQVRSTLADLGKNQEKITENPEYLGRGEDFIVLKKITVELDRGYALHNSLLKDYTDFPREYEWICRIKVNSLFEKRYQFQEALENRVRANLPNYVNVVEMLPLLLPTLKKSFNLLKIYEPQAIAGKKNDTSGTRTKNERTDRKLIDEIVKERQTGNFRMYADILLTSLAKSGDLDLTAYLEAIHRRLGEEGLENIDLIPFLIELNSGTEVILHTGTLEAARVQDPYETVFDLSTDHETQIRREPIEEALLVACNMVHFPYRILRVRAEPDDRIPIGETGDAYISQIRFLGEEKYGV